MIQRRYNFTDPLGLTRRYSTQQAFLDPGTALLGSSLVEGGTQLIGGLLQGDSGGSVKKISTLDPGQKALNQALTDFLMGYVRSGDGSILSQSPILFEQMGAPRPVVRLAGEINADGSVSGTLNATVNGVPQPPFSFRATSDALASSAHGDRSMLAPTTEDGYLEKASNTYSMIPTWAKVGAAGLAGYALYKRFMR